MRPRPFYSHCTYVATTLGVVVAFAVSAAVYSITRHLVVDKTIRLKRQNRAADAHAHAGEEHH